LTAREASDAAPGEVECTAPSTFLLRDQLQPAPHDLRLGAMSHSSIIRSPAPRRAWTYVFIISGP
jgi:hypothetical protein